MPRARKTLVNPGTTPFYHCICRCVRRAFLCGTDKYSGKRFEHRKLWITERLAVLAQVFAIEICAYAVMSNHYHLVLRIDLDKLHTLSDEQVVRRWGKLFRLPPLVSRFERGLELGVEERKRVQAVIDTWRARLGDLSWYMRCLNEYLARRANHEDRCKGRFWEGRYKSQALLDEAAVLTAMCYVDLNPVRAGLAETPEASDFTSAQQRILALKGDASKNTDSQTRPRLMRLAARRKTHHALSYTASDYLALVDWAGRAVREGKRGYIPERMPPLLDRLGLVPEVFLRELGSARASRQVTMLGHTQRLRAAAAELGRCFVKGMSLARVLYVG